MFRALSASLLLAFFFAKPLHAMEEKDGGNDLLDKNKIGLTKPYHPDTHEKATEAKDIHGLILKACLPEGQEILFVPSHHFTLFKDFSLKFQEEVNRQSFLIVEKDDESGVTYKHITKDFIKSIDGFQPEGTAWSLNLLDNGLKLEETYQGFFTAKAVYFEELASKYGKSLDMSHFRNIYEMKPGVVYALYHTFHNSDKHKDGMDSEIKKIFHTELKNAVGIETQEDVIQSLSLGKVTLEEIQDDFLTPDMDVYCPSLERLHEHFMDYQKQKRLMTSKSLITRNCKWINKYKEMIDQHVNCVAVHGQFHFPGQGGLIYLTQVRKWKWSVFQKDGSYLPFTYSPNNLESPFSWDF